MNGNVCSGMRLCLSEGIGLGVEWYKAGISTIFTAITILFLLLSSLLLSLLCQGQGADQSRRPVQTWQQSQSMLDRA